MEAWARPARRNLQGPQCQTSIKLSKGIASSAEEQAYQRKRLWRTVRHAGPIVLINSDNYTQEGRLL
jgi:hypothetical protein